MIDDSLDAEITFSRVFIRMMNRFAPIFSFRRWAIAGFKSVWPSMLAEYEKVAREITQMGLFAVSPETAPLLVLIRPGSLAHKHHLRGLAALAGYGVRAPDVQRAEGAHSNLFGYLIEERHDNFILAQYLPRGKTERRATPGVGEGEAPTEPQRKATT